MKRIVLLIALIFTFILFQNSTLAQSQPAYLFVRFGGQLTSEQAMQLDDQMRQIPVVTMSRMDAQTGVYFVHFNYSDTYTEATLLHQLAEYKSGAQCFVWGYLSDSQMNYLPTVCPDNTLDSEKSK